jgi:hypothetical protein
VRSQKLIWHLSYGCCWCGGVFAVVVSEQHPASGAGDNEVLRIQQIHCVAEVAIGRHACHLQASPKRADVCWQKARTAGGQRVTIANSPCIGRHRLRAHRQASDLGERRCFDPV